MRKLDIYPQPFMNLSICHKTNQTFFRTNPLLTKCNELEEGIQALQQWKTCQQEITSQLLCYLNGLESQVGKMEDKYQDVLRTMKQQFVFLNAQVDDIHVKMNEYEERSELMTQQINQQKKAQTTLDRQLIENIQQHYKMIQRIQEQEQRHEELEEQLHKQEVKRREVANQLLLQEKMQEKLENHLREQEQQQEIVMGEVNHIQEELLQEKEERKKTEEVKKHPHEEIQALFSYVSPISEMLTKLPPNYPVDTLYLGGKEVHVSNFVKILPNLGVAHFRNGEKLITVDYHSVHGVKW